MNDETMPPLPDGILQLNQILVVPYCEQIERLIHAYARAYAEQEVNKASLAWLDACNHEVTADREEIRKSIRQALFALRWDERLSNDTIDFHIGKVIRARSQA